MQFVMLCHAGMSHSLPCCGMCDMIVAVGGAGR